MMYRPLLRDASLVVLGCGFVMLLGAAFPSQMSRVEARIAAAASPITCSSTGTSSCLNVTNSSSGVAVYGTSNSGTGLRGLSTSNYGLKATSSSNYGIFGQSSTGGAGVYGTMKNGNGVIGVDSGSGTGVSGSSVSGYGVYATSPSGIGVGAYTSGPLESISGANGGTGDGVDASSASGVGLYARASGSQPTASFAANGSGDGLDIFSAGNAGIDIESTGKLAVGMYANVASGVAIVGASPSDQFPLALFDSDGDEIFYVDGQGDEYVYGSVTVRMAGKKGAPVTAFGSKAAAPTVEDTGSAHLANGTALVALDRIFASTIDSGSAYHVLITPEGDSRGLYVASKTPLGFVVRESQGGRSTLDFDYRIVATPIGHGKDRMFAGEPRQAMRPRLAAIRRR